ncbi:nucleotidyltransferase family protein [Lysobacter capsici]|uniref:nucleotidyltransferase family protein n=1 Tax=Lysobacter capsici TaxID=435897 RepID=UPI000BBAEDEC|nr:nucleotidyltransferase family protein [Lysobacter capsici]ATE73681.1 CTP--molybdopterin cytidylyltransferase [Lysobacter capsici]
MTRAAASHAAVVLAAGASRRLGRPKQLLTRDGETLLHRAARLAAASGALRSVVVLGARREAMQAAVAGLDLECVFNPDWEQGLSSSLRAAARALEDFDGPVLVLGCDQPALDGAHLSALIAGASWSPGACAATVHGGALGIPALIPPALWRQSTGLHGDRGFGAALARQLPGAVWRLQAPELEWDLDTPADVAVAIERGWIDADQAAVPGV